MKTSLLVLGANGFIGRQLVARLAGAGRTVIAATRHAVEFGHPNINNLVAKYDCRDDFLRAIEPCATVIHAAADSTPGSSVAQPQLDGNLRTTLALIEALQAHPDTRLVYFSSGGTIYGDRDEPASESCPLRPRSYHGAGKAAAEAFISAWAAQYRGKAVILRPSNVYGPGQAARKGFGIIPAAFDATLRNVPLEIWGDGSSIRDYLYITDLLRLSESVIDTDIPTGAHPFNVSGGAALTLTELLDRVESVTGKPLARNYRPARISDVHRITMNDNAVRTYFDWLPATSLDEGLANAWSWFSTSA